MVTIDRGLQLSLGLALRSRSQYSARCSGLTLPDYHFLARNLWRRRKGRFVHRIHRRSTIVVQHLQSAPMLSNTSCTQLLASASVLASAVALPP
jgi:hypothetical protein